MNQKVVFSVFAAPFIGFFLFGTYGYVTAPTREVIYDARIDVLGTSTPLELDTFVVTHLQTPEPLRGVYMTSWVAGTPHIRKNIVKLIEETELNAVVIDVKDYSGKISFLTDEPLVMEYGGIENRISDIEEFIGELHDNGIYVIARVTVFQDPHLTSVRPDLAVLRESDKSVWTDYKGLSFTDPGFSEVWDYHVSISRAAYDVGFDEINFDYIRFPSDGDLTDVYYPASEDVIVADPIDGKAEVIESFFAYLSNELSDIDVVLSADLFGMTTVNSDDLNIGQVLERAEPYFDYIAPMVYPSHYPKTFIGINNPASEPYKVVKYSLDSGVQKLLNASSTPTKLRPWLQDFDLGAIYTPELVRAQIGATYDAGLTSWMLWDAANTYTKEALVPYYDETLMKDRPSSGWSDGEQMEE